MNTRTIKIQEIIGIGHDGEYSQAPSYNPQQAPNLSDNIVADPLVVGRIIEHISHMAEFVKKIHARKTDTESEEHLTRLSLNEFSFYTFKAPLILDQYKEIIAGVSKIATTLPPNIHLILGTFPIYWPNKKLFNSALYVQAPKKENTAPILHHFHKRVASSSDLAYYFWFKKQYQLYDIRERMQDVYKTEYSPHVVLERTAITTYDVNQYRSAIQMTTRDGQEFSSTIEICMEHTIPHPTGVADLNSLFFQLQRHLKPLPSLGTHVVMSSSTFLDPTALTAPVIHADPLYAGRSQQLICSKRDGDVIPMNAPVFGHKFHFEVFEPVAMGKIKNNNFILKSPSRAEIVETIQRRLTPSMEQFSLNSLVDCTPEYEDEEESPYQQSMTLFSPKAGRKTPSLLDNSSISLNP